MPSELSRSCSLMLTAVKKNVLPDLHARGFTEIPQHKEPIPMWHLNRPRAAGGYDAISIFFDKVRRPRFHAVINYIKPEGVTYPSGELVPANQVTASALLERVYIQKIAKGPLSFILPRWFGHTMFGFKPQEGAAYNQQAAEVVCAEFIACMDQAERWWVTGEIGPNLVAVNGHQPNEPKGSGR